MRSAAGDVRALLWRSEAGFPSDADKAVAGAIVKASPGAVRLVFRDVPAGRYAVSTIHDLDGDGTLAKNRFGMPLEAVGISNGALGFFGPKPFEQALVEIGPDGAVLTIELRHW